MQFSSVLDDAVAARSASERIAASGVEEPVTPRGPGSFLGATDIELPAALVDALQPAAEERLVKKKLRRLSAKLMMPNHSDRYLSNLSNSQGTKPVRLIKRR
jgi:hypothetical protein